MNQNDQNAFAIQWYQEREKKRQDNYESGQMKLINRNLQNILHQIEGQINKERYSVQESYVNRMLASSYVWNIGYLNDTERKEVAIEQALFISLILHVEESIANRMHLQEEVDRYMRQLGIIDWGMYGEFNRRKQSILRIKDKTTELKRHL